MILKCAFIYENIKFFKCRRRQEESCFQLNNQPEPAVRFTLMIKTNLQQDYAKACAISIQQWLKSAAENPVVFLQMKTKQKIKHWRAENIAVLVRGYTEADLVKKNCKHLVLLPVYLSDRGNVFESNTAKELALILQACLRWD